MDDMDPWLVEVFFDVQRGLPRQGVGNDESTSNALALCSELPDNPAVLDIGCGPGMQTMFLAESTSGSVVAVDTCDEYLDELRQKLEQASLPDRVQVKHADMTALDFPGNTFDVIWCEGAIYNMGVAEALKTWRPLLRDKGYLVFSELVWLDDEPAVEVADFFRDGYPAMTSIEANIKMIRESGYEPVDDFTLDEAHQLQPVDVNPEIQATLLVGSHISAWTDHTVSKAVPSEEFDTYIEQLASLQGIDTSKPFVFTANGDFIGVRLHVIQGACPVHAKQHGVELSENEKPFEGSYSRLNGTLVGVFAKNAAGELTHPDTSTHTHVVFNEPTSDARVTAHVEQTGLDEGAVIRFPKQN